MQQFSSDGSPVEIELLSGSLLFIDPLYLQEIANHMPSVKSFPAGNKIHLVQQLEKEVFPYSGGRLLGYKEVAGHTYTLHLSRLKRFDHTNKEKEQRSFRKEITAFASDSGSFLILDLANFDTLLKMLQYDDLTSAALEGRFATYQEKVNDALGNKAWAYVLSPGIHSGFDFQGSGSFYVADR